MNSMQNQILRSLAFAMALIAGSAFAQPAVNSNAAWVAKEFRVSIAGTSTLHEWTVASNQAEARMDITGNTVTGSLSIPSKSLTGGPKGLDERMHGALKVNLFPTISFEAVNPPAFAERMSSGAFGWTVRGRLTLAGTTRDITVPCTVTIMDPHQLALETEIEIRMTDYGIKPPTFMGMIRTGDLVKVKISMKFSELP